MFAVYVVYVVKVQGFPVFTFLFLQGVKGTPPENQPYGHKDRAPALGHAVKSFGQVKSLLIRKLDSHQNSMILFNKSY